MQLRTAGKRIPANDLKLLNTKSVAKAKTKPAAKRKGSKGCGKGRGKGRKFREVEEGEEPAEAEFFRPTPSWLPPGRSTRSIACFKLAARVN